MQNGSSGATYTFSGNLSGSGTWAMAANVRMNNVLTGSLKDFSGTLSTNETSANNNRQAWNFGSGGGCATGEGNSVFGDGAILGGNTGSTDTGLAAQYNVNYNNTELVLNALVQGNSSLTHAGTGTLILDQANTATGALGITNAGAVVPAWHGSQGRPVGRNRAEWRGNAENRQWRADLRHDAGGRRHGSHCRGLSLFCQFGGN